MRHAVFAYRQIGGHMLDLHIHKSTKNIQKKDIFVVFLLVVVMFFCYFSGYQDHSFGRVSINDETLFP